MYWIQTIVILLLLNSVENFNLISSHLQNPSFELKSNTSTTRVSHTCFVDCNFILTFNQPLVLPESCTRTETNYTCEMIITIDYRNQEIDFLSFAYTDSLTMDNITYDSIAAHAAYLRHSDNSAYHIVNYACAAGSYCEWEYAQQIIPKLITIDYQPLYNLLLPKVFNSNGHPNITQCFRNTELVNCSTGSCNFFESANDAYNSLISRDCAIFRESSVEVGQVRYTPGPAKHDYDTIGFTCNEDQCNDATNEYEIKQIISSNGNEFIGIHSLGTKFHLINFSFYFLCLVLIQYLK